MATKTPERSCIVCKNKYAKKDLFRIVNRSDDTSFYELDPTGKLNGRGAYICKNECADKLTDKDIERSFKKAIPKGTSDKIRLQWPHTKTEKDNT